MAVSATWIESNWFNLLQTVGIIGSFFATAMAVYRDGRARELQNLLTIADQHRELWHGAAEKPSLARIFQDAPTSLEAQPTPEEQEFINSVLVHYQLGWHWARNGGMITLRELAEDLRGFFRLPLPRAVWEKTKSYRNRRFVAFVDKAIALERVR